MGDDRPYGVTLKNAVDFAAQQKGLRIEDLSEGDVVTVVTMNTCYVFMVLETGGRKVQILSGNTALVPDGITTYVNGSSMTGTGSMVRLGWIGVGFRLWLGNVLLTETREISVNGEPFQTTDDDNDPVVTN